MEDIQQYLESARVEIDEELDRLLPAADHFPPSIHQAMRYSVLAGGKRLRPILCLEAGRLLGGDNKDAGAPGERAARYVSRGRGLEILMTAGEVTLCAWTG
jgi:geranylgeranyl diphosphate synthase type II